MRKTVLQRFFEKFIIDSVTGCWLWTAQIYPTGYAAFYHSQGWTKRAARIAYILFRGPIPEGLQIDHLCRVRRCVNPWHLEAVTAQENTRRSRRSPLLGKYKLRITECPQGHRYIGKNLAVRPNGHRYCRACHRADTARYLARKRVAISVVSQE